MSDAAVGPGKYDDLATIVRERADAEAVIVIVFSGNLGSGFSVQTRGEDIARTLPAILRNLADGIEGAMN
jgi:hypothetical protein